MKPYVNLKGKARWSLFWGDKVSRKTKNYFKKSKRQELKKDTNENLFSVNFGHGIEKLSYYELQARFLTLTEEEKKYITENSKTCTQLTDIPEGYFYSNGVISIEECFNNCNELTFFNEK